MPTAVTRATRGLHHGVSVAGLAVLALLIPACSDDGDDPVAETTESSTPSPVITAPPTKSPEEKAEAEIIDTFETLIADRDHFNANADEFTQDDISQGEPVASWPVTGDGELELFNQASIWLDTQINAVGNTVIKSHSPTDVKLNVTGDLDIASSIACIDLTQVTFATYSGELIENPPFKPDKYQRWTMGWEYLTGEESPGGSYSGWHLSELDIEHGLNSC